MTQDDDDEVTRQVVAQWKAAAPALAEQRRRELAEMTDEQALAATCALFEALDQLPRWPLRPSSGLVEQQRLFGLARPR